MYVCVLLARHNCTLVPIAQAEFILSRMVDHPKSLPTQPKFRGAYNMAPLSQIQELSYEYAELTSKDVPIKNKMG